MGGGEEGRGVVELWMLGFWGGVRTRTGRWGGGRGLKQRQGAWRGKGGEMNVEISLPSISPRIQCLGKKRIN